MKSFWIGLAVAGFGLTLAAPDGARAANPCADLKAASLPHATVNDAAEVASGAATACRIRLTSRPTADSDIRIEVWIPAGAAWNGRFVQLGNGGFAGSISSPRLAAVAARGYAVAATDDGHQTTDGTDGRWAVGHPEKVVDFGWRALKETTDTAKVLIRAYTGTGAKYAYFQGCSDGGREALMEAQRFPTDFDGIVAGAPAYDFTGLLTLAAYDVQSLAKPGAYLGADQRKTLEAGALAGCGGGRFVAQQAQCRFDLASVACPPGEDHPTCLTAPQVAAARALYDGLRSANGRILYPGYSPGAEAEPGSWALWITGQGQADSGKALIALFGGHFFADFVFQDPAYDVLKLDVAGAHELVSKLAAILDSTSPDLRTFRAHGGKLIQYHGWNDPAIPARGSIVYYEDVRRTMGETGDFHRLYMVPGMLHCGGGASPSSVEWLSLLEAWRERGQAPGLVTATSGPAAGGATQTLCPYPGQAVSDADRAPRCAGPKPPKA